jgi:hypothetical protein
MLVTHLRENEDPATLFSVVAEQSEENLNFAGLQIAVILLKIPPRGLWEE